MVNIPASLMAQRPQAPSQRPLTLGQQRQQAKYEAYQKLSTAEKEALQKSAEQSYIETETTKLYTDATSYLKNKVLETSQTLSNLQNAKVRQEQMLQGEQNRDAIKGIYDTIRQLSNEITQTQATLHSYNQTLQQPRDILINYYQQGYADKLAQQAAREVRTSEIFGVKATTVEPVMTTTLTRYPAQVQTKEMVQAKLKSSMDRILAPPDNPLTRALSNANQQTTNGIETRNVISKDRGNFVLIRKMAEEEEIARAAATREKEIINEIAAPTVVFNVNAKRETVSYVTKQDKDLSIDAQFYKKSRDQELPEVLKVEQRLKDEFNKIQKNVNQGNLNVEQANIKLDSVQQKILDDYNSAAKLRQEKLQDKYYPKSKFTTPLLPNLSKVDPYATAQKFYESKIGQAMPQWLRNPLASGIISTTSFGKGFIETARTQPKKLAESAAVLSVGGLVSLASGGTAAAPAVAWTGATLGTIWGGSVALRIGMTPGYSKKFEVAGGIASTELVPALIIGGLTSMASYKPPKIEGLTQKETTRLYDLQKAGGYSNPQITAEFASLRFKAINALKENPTAINQFNKVFPIKQYESTIMNPLTGVETTRNVFIATKKQENALNLLSDKFNKQYGLESKSKLGLQFFGQPKESVFVGFGRTFKDQRAIEIYVKQLQQSGKLSEYNIKTKEDLASFIKENIKTRTDVVPARLQQGGMDFKYTTFKRITGYSELPVTKLYQNVNIIGSEGKFYGSGISYQIGSQGRKIAVQGLLTKFNLKEGKGEYYIIRRGRNRYFIESMQKGKITYSKQISNKAENELIRFYESEMSKVNMPEYRPTVDIVETRDIMTRPFSKDLGVQISKQKTIDVTFYGKKNIKVSATGKPFVQGNKEFGAIETIGVTSQPTFRVGVTKIKPGENIFMNIELPKPSKPSKPWDLGIETPKVEPSTSISNLINPKLETSQLNILDLQKSLQPSITPKVTTIKTPSLKQTSKPTFVQLLSNVGLTTKLNVNRKLQLKQNQIFETNERIFERQEPIPTQKDIQKQIETVIPKIETVVVQVPKQEIVPIIINGGGRRPQPDNPFTFKTPDLTKPRKPGRFNWLFPREAQQQQQKAYYPEVRIDATKKVKAHWERVSDIPQTKESAISQAARVVDKTISAKGRVVEAPKKEVARDTGDRYFEINRRKFRGWQQKKGVRYKTPNQIIELQKYRADSPSEVGSLKKGRQEKRVSMFGFR